MAGRGVAAGRSALKKEEKMSIEKAQKIEETLDRQAGIERNIFDEINCNTPPLDNLFEYRASTAGRGVRRAEIAEAIVALAERGLIEHAAVNRNRGPGWRPTDKGRELIKSALPERIRRVSVKWWRERMWALKREAGAQRHNEFRRSVERKLQGVVDAVNAIEA
jgi:hypothetical protein